MTTVYRIVMWPGGGGEAIFSTMDAVHQHIANYPPHIDTVYHIYEHNIDRVGFTYRGSYPKLSRKLSVDLAAVRDVNGVVHTLPRPARHHTILHKMREDGIQGGPEEEQGFTLTDGSFVSRKEAAHIAIKTNQVGKLIAPPDLYSEDLW